MFARAAGVLKESEKQVQSSKKLIDIDQKAGDINQSLVRLEESVREIGKDMKEMREIGKDVKEIKEKIVALQQGLTVQLILINAKSASEVKELRLQFALKHTRQAEYSRRPTCNITSDFVEEVLWSFRKNVGYLLPEMFDDGDREYLVDVLHRLLGHKPVIVSPPDRYSTDRYLIMYDN
ncbi:hypothetical protein ACA910_007827 [Epithemia clementina (nom. ined.)]